MPCEFCKIMSSIVGGLVLGTHWVRAIKKAVVGHKQLNTVGDGCWRNIVRDAKFFGVVDDVQDCILEPSAGALHDL